MNLDVRGTNCLFCNLLSNIVDLDEHLPLFGIWGLLSKEQRTLVSIMQFTSINQICRSFLPLWAKDSQILEIAISNFVSSTQPLEQELDDFILLCVCCGKKILAKKLASSSHQDKLAKSIEGMSTGQIKPKKDDMKKYMKNIQKAHMSFDGSNNVSHSGHKIKYGNKIKSVTIEQNETFC